MYSLQNFSSIYQSILEKNADFIGSAIFTIHGHLEFSTTLNFAILKHWSLIVLHVKFEIHGCSG